MEQIKLEHDMFHEILHEAKLGIWIIKMESDKAPQMYASNELLTILGVTKELSPEELYCFWFERIHSNYIDYILNTIEEMKKGKKEEVEYPWEHPEKGTTYVRCGGEGKLKNNAVYFRGYHQDITDLMLGDKTEYTGYQVNDFYKLKKYSSYLIENYDKLYEVDLETKAVEMIFYNTEKYVGLLEKENVFKMLKQNIYPEDQKKVMNVLQQEVLKELFETRKVKRIEVRAKTKFDTYQWVRVNFFVRKFKNKMKLIVYSYDISENKELKEIAKEKEELIQALLTEDSAIIDIDLDENMVKILRYDDLVENRSKEVKFCDFIKKFIDHYIHPTDRKAAIQLLTYNNLKNTIEKKEGIQLNLRLNSGKYHYEWVRMLVFLYPNSKERLFLLLQNINHEYIMKSITEKFVYNQSDFIYYIDLNNNIYTKFVQEEENQNVKLKNKGNNYYEDVIKLVEYYVVSEDIVRLKEQLKIENIMKALEEQTIWNIEMGVTTEKKEYKRKQLQFQYYDKENKIVLMQQRDITKEYQTKQKSKIDYLTGIYNRLGCESEIQQYLRKRTEFQKEAFILVDLDNFKMVNDKLGHQIGDQVLKDVSHIIKKEFEEKGIVARFGGDEFVVFVKDRGEERLFETSIKKLIDALHQTYEKGGKKVTIGASIGIAYSPEHGTTFKELYKKSDKAMYGVKKIGKNNYKIYNEVNEYVI